MNFARIEAASSSIAQLAIGQANREPKRGARAKRARPLFGGGRRPPPLYWPKNVKKMSGKCLWTFLGHFFDIFWTFFQRQPQHQDIFRTFFWEAARKPQKALWDIFFIFRGQAHNCKKNVFFYIFCQLENQKGARARPLLGGCRRPPPL